MREYTQVQKKMVYCYGCTAVKLGVGRSTVEFMILKLAHLQMVGIKDMSDITMGFKRMNFPNNIGHTDGPHRAIDSHIH